MSKTGIFRKITSNDYVFSVIAKIISVVVGVFHAAFLARFLGPELKGVAASINSIVSVGSVILTIGIHQAFPYYRKNDQSKEFVDKFCSTVLVLYAVLFALGLVLALTVPVGIKVSFAILLIPLFSYETIINYIHLVEKPKERNVVNILSSIAETVALLLLWLLLEPNNGWMLVGISLSMSLRAIFSTVKLKFRFYIKHFRFSYVLQLVRFGWLPMIALLLTMLNSRVDILMLNGYAHVTNVQIGIYSVGVGLAEKALYIPDAIREILLGRLVAGKAADEVAKACRISFSLAIFIALGCLLFGQPVIWLLYGREYIGAYGVTVVSVVGTVFMVFLKMISQYNIVHKKQLLNAMLLGVSVVVNVALNFVLIPTSGIMGAAIATLAGHFVCGICFIVFFMRSANMKLRQILLIQREDLQVLKKLLFKRHK